MTTPHQFLGIKDCKVFQLHSLVLFVSTKYLQAVYEVASKTHKESAVKCIALLR